VEGKKPRRVNSGKWRPSDSSSLTAAGKAIPQWTEDIPSYSWVVVIRKQDNTRWFKYDRDCLCVNLATSVLVIFEPPCTQPGRRKEQRSSDSTEENGNYTEETQHGLSQSPPNIGVRQENGKKMNK